jgi:hypothetical protein
VIPATSIDDLEARLDQILGEVRLRQRQRASLRRTGHDDVAGALAGVRRELRCWAARAAADAPRASGERPA